MSVNPSGPDSVPKPAEPDIFVARSLAASLTVSNLQRSLAWYQDVVLQGDMAEPAEIVKG